ncbi:MAG TPA: hypothetical protein VFS20_28150 [Longimicrobium sp.]|nr:hypothetical protein [Longimicrobium sp.]
MKKAAAVLAIIGFALAVFGWWGIYTAAGMRRYDEMDGLIPFFGGVAGLFLLGLAGIVALFAAWRSRRKIHGRRPASPG